jgi:hypothetical protein
MSDFTRFAVRTIDPESRTVAVDSFDLEPSNQQGQLVCQMFSEFLAARPTEFRDPLDFIKKYAMELEWAAAGGGCAYASFFQDGTPITMLVLLCGYIEREETLMLQGMKAAILQKMLGDDTDRLMDLPERPAVLQVLLPGHPEMRTTINLLTSALASVYFRAMERLLAKEMEDYDTGTVQ